MALLVRVSRLENALIEMPFAKDRLGQIKRMRVLADILAFEH